MGRGEIAVIGLGRSGRAVAELIARHGGRAYVSDAGSGAGVRTAADALLAKGIAVDVGHHDLERISRAVAVVASPGVPPTAPPLVTTAQAGVPILSEVEAALAFLPSTTRYIAVTGTNGKTTVTALIHHLLDALGANAVAAGNIGTPVSVLAMEEHPPEWIALEMSSFQLHDTPSLAPVVGVLTNLAPDHLDRYASLDEYYGDKMRLFANATPRSRWVTNADDAEVQRRVRGIVGTHHRFSLDTSTDRSVTGEYPSCEGVADLTTGEVTLFATPFMLRRDIPLLGDHNVANVLAAVLAVAVADPAYRTPEARARMAAAVATFGGMPHRLQVVADVSGVQWINDSKATNVASTTVAVAGMTRPTVVLLGGRHKGEPYSALIPLLKAHAKLVIAYGEAAPLIEADLAGHVPLERLGSSFEEVVSRARAATRPGDAVLLSPACSSYDMFNNYEERGSTFQRLAVDA